MERFVDVPGARLYVEDHGSGPPILMLHAAIANLRAWDTVAAGLTAAGYRAIRYDLRGFGRSETEEVSFSNRADAIAVLDSLAVDRAALVGNSAGGQIAIDTTIEFPERVTALVTIGSGPGGFDPGNDSPIEAALFEEGELLESAEVLDADAIADLDVRLWVDGPGQPPDRVPSEIREAVRAMDRPQFLPGHVNGKPIPLTPPANDRLDALTVPFLVMYGELDVSYMAKAAERLVAEVPTARAVPLPGVAHMPGLEVPDKVSALILEFLAPLPRWS